jgi:hypothetical protein
MELLRGKLMELKYATLERLNVGLKLYRFIGGTPSYFGTIIAIYDTFIIVNTYGSSGLIEDTNDETLIKNEQSNKYSFIEPAWNFMTTANLFLNE